MMLKSMFANVSGIVYSVGHQPLELSILVRVQVPEPVLLICLVPFLPRRPRITFRGSSRGELQSAKCKRAKVARPKRACDSPQEGEVPASVTNLPPPRELPTECGSVQPALPL